MFRCGAPAARPPRLRARDAGARRAGRRDGPPVLVFIPAYNRAQLLPPLSTRFSRRTSTTTRCAELPRTARRSGRRSATRRPYVVRMRGARALRGERREPRGTPTCARCCGTHEARTAHGERRPARARRARDRGRRDRDPGCAQLRAVRGRSVVVRVSRPFPEERHVPAGPDAVVTSSTAARRHVGRAAPRRGAAARDGAIRRHAVLPAARRREHPPRRDGSFLPQVLVLYRLGGVPDFGVNPRERGRFVPGAPPSTDLNMVQGLLAIAGEFDAAHGTSVPPAVLRDFAHYSYPTLAKQAHLPVAAFCPLLPRPGAARFLAQPALSRCRGARPAARRRARGRGARAGRRHAPRGGGSPARR